MRLTATEDAVVLQMAKLSVGSVLKEGDPLIYLAPLNSPVEAEIRISPQDVGFIRVGDPVKLKLDTFNFVEHGMVQGTSAGSAKAPSRSTNAPTQPTQSPYYKVRVALTDTNLRNVPPGFRLIPGMTLTADIHIGTRSILMYMVSGAVRHVKRRCVSPERARRPRPPAAPGRARRGSPPWRGRSGKAFRRFRRAAAAGDAEGQYWLGLLYARGEGVLASLCDGMVWFRRAAEQGHADAQYQLSLAYLNGGRVAAWQWYSRAAVDKEVAERNRELIFPNGLSVEADQAEALRWCRAAAEQGLRPRPGAARADVRARARLRNRLRRGAALVCAAAARGNAPAELGLGVIYANGFGVEADPAAGAAWYERAAAKGNSDAQVALALLCDAGQGMPSDPARAAALFEQAAEQRQSRAHYHFALHLLEGNGVAENRVMAETHLRRAALTGYRRRCCALAGCTAARTKRRCGIGRRPISAMPKRNSRSACCIARGEGVPQRLEIAARWFEKAAEQGHAAAQFNLGVVRLNGSGIERDPVLAANWLARAAEQGMVRAQTRLARLYFTGDGDAQDYRKAAEWLQRAAGAGDSEAETLLAGLYLSGNGVAHDPAEAERLLRSAAGRGYGPAMLQLGHFCAADRALSARQEEAVRWYRAAAERGVVAAQWIVAQNLSPAIGASASPRRRLPGFAGRPRPDMPGRNSSSASCIAPGPACRPIRLPEPPGIAAPPNRASKAAQHNLAVMLFRGDGVERDPEAAVEWYRKAAEQGLPEAQTALGDLYARGIGVAADPEAARAWYEKAAAQGHAPAQAKLAALRGPTVVATMQPLQVRTGG